MSAQKLYPAGHSIQHLFPGVLALTFSGGAAASNRTRREFNGRADGRSALKLGRRSKALPPNCLRQSPFTTTDMDQKARIASRCCLSGLADSCPVFFIYGVIAHMPRCGLARARSLGPRGPSPSVEFLSPFPKWLKCRDAIINCPCQNEMNFSRCAGRKKHHDAQTANTKAGLATEESAAP